MTNAQLASRILELADLIALEGSDPRRVERLRGAASAIGRFHHSLAELIGSGADLAAVPGIGRRLAGILGDLAASGRSPVLEEHRRRTPARVLALMRLHGVGPTRARVLREAGIDSPEALAAAVESGAVRRVAGFGPGRVSRVQGGLAAYRELAGKSLLAQADRALEVVAGALDQAGIEFRAAGDVARRVEAARAVDVVCAAATRELRACVAGEPALTLAREGGPDDNPVLARCGSVRVRLVAAPPGTLEAVAHHLTGPPEYIAALADRARERGMELTPTGLRGAADPADHARPGVDADDEQALYRRLGLPRIPPELRADAATVTRAESGVPDLPTLADLRGDLHMHTTWSDGAASVRRMVESAADRGYAYMAVTDHSPSTRVVRGLDGEALRSQAAEIAAVQADLPGIRILRGCEVDILPDGSLDLPDEVLASLDLVIASVHSSFEMTQARMTERMIRAMSNPLVHVVAHPTGRKIGRRPGYPLDLEAFLTAAAELGVAVEINGSPRRLDLDHLGARICGRLGVDVVLSSDAHGTAQLGNIRYGVDQARRGWLEKDRIVNTRSPDQLLQWLGRRRG